MIILQLKNLSGLHLQPQSVFITSSGVSLLFLGQNPLTYPKTPALGYDETMHRLSKQYKNATIISDLIP